MRHSSENGFSLVEVVFATGILSTALLSMAGVFVVGLQHLRSSTPGLIAREKAREAVESVHTARDMRIITWDQIRNEADGGVFKAGALPVYTPGADGLVNTDDDGDGVGAQSAADLETHPNVGPDQILGTPDDVWTPLTDFTRQIAIIDLFDENNVLNQNLRQITVTIGYKVGNAWRAYTLTTYVSSYS